MPMSLSRLGRALALATFTTSLIARVAAAQADSTPARPQGTPVQAVDSAGFERARRMVLGGNAVAGRALADSLVQAVPPGTPAFGDALYWRATIAATAADAERDYRRIIIEYPLAPHAGDALLALAQLEMSRGDRMSATSHLERFLLEFPERGDRPRAGLWLGRLLLDQNDVPKACAVLREADAAVPAEQVELKNQIDYYAPRCVGVESPAAPTAATSTPAPAAPAPATSASATPVSSTPAAASSPPVPAIDSTRAARPSGAPTATPTRAPAANADAASAKAPAPPANATAPRTSGTPNGPARSAKRQPAPSAARWTVQIAAYQTSGEAEALASKMKGRDLDAYVMRSARVYRVRIGHYATREEALTVLASLKKRGTSGFVTTADSSSR